MPKATTAVISPASKSGMPKSRLSPSAAPTNSARSVAIATISAWTQSIRFQEVGNASRQSSGRLCPVAMPTFEVRYWTITAIRLAMTMTQTSW